MIDLGLSLDVSDATNWLGRLPAEVRLKLLAGMADVVSDLVSGARAAAPQGRTGNLAASVNGRVEADARGVVGRVTAGKFYSRFVEGGVHSTFEVRPYARRNRRGISVVKQHERTEDWAGEPFMRPTYEARQSRVEARLAQAVQEATEDGSGS